MKRTPSGPDRQVKIIVPYTQYDWWLARWADNQAVCDLVLDHEGLPKGLEIYRACGTDIFNQWKKTDACPGAAEGTGNTESCSGLYLHLVQSSPATRTVEVRLPPPVVWVTLTGCDPGEGAPCDELPSLLLTANEPLPNEQITAVHAAYASETSDCLATSCLVPLKPTGPDGAQLVFWADSSHGDSSEKYTAHVRVEEGPPDEAGWYVDVLSTQWRGPSAGSCALWWDAFPPVGKLPDWLSTPTRLSAIASAQPLDYLASRLIVADVVDTTECPSGGLLPNEMPDGCGRDQASPLVDAWQDRFDAAILEAAAETGVPAQLMKNVFVQESQLWPGAFVSDAKEFGLGQLTERGADTTLLWNQPFFQEFCPLVLDDEQCDKGYAQLGEASRATLRGALVARADATCQECPLGVDLTRANFSVELFAQTLLANCEQTGRMVYNTTRQTPGRVSTYEDLWRFTLASYNAGPGCVADALRFTWRQDEPLDWEHVAARLPDGCKGAVGYVEAVSSNKD